MANWDKNRVFPMSMFEGQFGEEMAEIWARFEENLPTLSRDEKRTELSRMAETLRSNLLNRLKTWVDEGWKLPEGVSRGPPGKKITPKNALRGMLCSIMNFLTAASSVAERCESGSGFQNIERVLAEAWDFATTIKRLDRA